MEVAAYTVSSAAAWEKVMYPVSMPPMLVSMEDLSNTNCMDLISALISTLVASNLQFTTIIIFNVTPV